MEKLVGTFEMFKVDDKDYKLLQVEKLEPSASDLDYLLSITFNSYLMYKYLSEALSLNPEREYIVSGTSTVIALSPGYAFGCDAHFTTDIFPELRGVELLKLYKFLAGIPEQPIKCKIYHNQIIVSGFQL